MNSINNATMTVNNQETVINSSTVINMEEVTKNSKRKKRYRSALQRARLTHRLSQYRNKLSAGYKRSTKKPLQKRN